VGVYGNQVGQRTTATKIYNNYIYNSANYGIAYTNGALENVAANNIISGGTYSIVSEVLPYVVTVTETNNIFSNAVPNQCQTITTGVVASRATPATCIENPTIETELDSSHRPIAGSSVIQAGVWYGDLADATGIKFRNPPSIGAYEYRSMTTRAIRE
jgi:hypothetical protein